MTAADHTPSPATDGLREAIEKLADLAAEHLNCSGCPTPWWLTNWLHAEAAGCPVPASPSETASLTGDESYPGHPCPEHGPDCVGPTCCCRDKHAPTPPVSSDEDRAEHPCGDWPAPCNCDDSETHNGKGRR